MRTVEQAMGEDLVMLAERCDKLEAANAEWKRRYEEAQEQVSVRETTLERLEAENAALFSQLQSAQREIVARIGSQEIVQAENARLKADGQRTVDEYKNLLEHYQTAEAENARLKEALRTWAPLNEAKAEVAAWRGRFESYRFNGREIVPVRAALAGKD